MSVPAAGKLKASGKHFSSASKDFEQRVIDQYGELTPAAAS
jgi:hypothetical protein